MEFSPVLAGQTRDGTAIDGDCGAAVCVPRVDVAGLSDAGLRGRLRVLGESESQLEALKVRTMAEMARRHDTAGAKKVAREVLRSSPSKAHHDVKAAERLAGLAATSEALASGEVPAGHARLIARASSEGPIDERELVEAAKTQTYDELAKTVKRQQHELSGDDGQSIHDRRKQKRSARLFQNGDTGMYVLNAELDPITGKYRVVPPPETFPDRGITGWQPKHLNPVLRN